MIHAVDDVAQVMSDYMAGELEKARVAARPDITSRGWRVEPDADSPWLYHYYIVQEVMQEFTFLAYDPRFHQVKLEISFGLPEILGMLHSAVRYEILDLNEHGGNDKHFETPSMFVNDDKYHVFPSLSQISTQRHMPEKHTIHMTYDTSWNASIVTLLWLAKHGLFHTVLQQYVNIRLQCDVMKYDALSHVDIVHAVYMMFRRNVVRSLHDVIQEDLLDPDLPWEWQHTILPRYIADRLGDVQSMQKDFEYILQQEQELAKSLPGRAATV